MQFQYTTVSPLELETDLLVLTMPCAGASEPLVDAVDRALGGALAEQMSASRFTGKRGQMIYLHPTGRPKARRLLLLGRGDPDSFDPAELRNLVATAVRHAAGQGVKSLSFVVPKARDGALAARCQLVAEGALLGAYRFDKYLSAENRPPAP